MLLPALLFGAAWALANGPPETRPAAWNRTVRACCPGWGGTHCTLALAEVSPEGHCFATWLCNLGAGSVNASAGSLEECCARPWGHSWRDGRSQTCHRCSNHRRLEVTVSVSSPGSTPSPAILQPLAGAVAQLWSQRQRPSATCATWSGFHYRTFDGRHFHFLGRCTYLLAGTADATWAVHLQPRGHCPQPGHCQLARVMMGPEEVLIRGENVSVNGRLVPEGVSQLLPGLSLQWQGDWLVLSGGLGVVVRLDRSSSVSISVDRELQGQTQGLCGVYNGRPEDDFLEPGRGLAALAATFGNSWRLPDSELGCLDAVEAAQGCEDPLRDTETDTEAGRLRAEAQDVCHQLLEGPFRECHTQVPPAEYHEACLFAYCAGAPAGSGRAERLESVCATLASYAQDCAARRIAVRWRKPGFCERLCPGGQLYSDCASACPPSCSAVGEGSERSCGEECVSGCECPPGLFWDGALCVPAARCPCYRRRRRYEPGDVVRQLCNPCVCRDGRWLCAQAPCAAECAVGGDGHYVTFDGRSFSFRGRSGCRFSLVQDFAKRQLLIVLEYGDCDAGSCLQAISVSLGDILVQLRDSGAVLVDGQDVALPWSTAGGLSVSRASSSFLLLRWPGARILWGVSDSAAYITLDPHHAHQVQGLCGTFTRNQQDDFLTPAGDVETSITAFASKFQVAGKGTCSLEASTPLSPCSTHTERQVFAEVACAILHGPTFQECHGLVDREPFHLRCLAAVCGCAPGRDCLCPVLAAYARRCAQEGALPSWRNRTFCPVLCPGGQEYQECAPACGHNCGEPEDCRELDSCVAGCNCPLGLLWDPEGQCVPPNLCPCQLGARRYAPGSAAMKDCNRCVCQERGLWNCTAHRCAPPRAFCPGELVYVPGACLLTCDSPDADRPCPPGSPRGCVCPPGTVLLEERCVPPELCPCRHSGQWYLPNATIQEDCNLCVCQGRQWHCTGQQCDGRCWASGAPHYVTFDGLALTFPGACEYLLVREASGQFTVSAQNLPCGASGLTCTKALTVRLQGTIVHMLRGTRVLVQLSPQLRGRVAGLCGDFDGDASNDLRSRQGVLEPTAELAAHSWRLGPLCPEPGDLLHPCAVNAYRAGWARARCGVVLQPLFARCHVEVPPQPHYERCVYDACGCDSGGDCECLCSAIATYADECARHGIHVRWRSQELCRGICLELAACPCELGGSFFPPGTVLQKDCGNCTCRESQWLCGDDGGRCVEPEPVCAEGETPCQESGHCVPHGWLCDNQDDCGDGSDEEGCATLGCGEGQVSCSSGRCLPLVLLCDGQDDCGDGTDEQGCPCPQDSLACADGHCVPPARLCDGHPDCLDAADEESCLGQLDCAPGEVSCIDGTCLGAIRLCDGVWDCLDGADEGPGHCPLPSLPTPPAGTLPGPSAVSWETAPTPLASVSPALPCGPLDFACGSGECAPRGWRCDGEGDCADGSDESGCDQPCAPHHAPCARGPHCVAAEQLCDGVPHCPDGSDEGPGACEGLWAAGGPNQTGLPCPEYSCPDGLCIRFQQVCDGQPDCELAGTAGLSPEEQGCGAWGPWSPWEPCSQTCGPGAQGRSRRCSPPSLPVLRHCPGPERQTRACFSAACPEDGAWTSWSRWSPCSEPCGGVTARHRECHPPQNGGRTCAMLPGGPPSTRETRPCPQDGCPSVTCSGELVFHACAPCPLTCDDISGQAACPTNRPCGGPGENQTVHPMATPMPAPTPSPQIGAPLITYLLPPPGGIMVQGAGSSDWLQVSSDGLHWHSYRDIRPGIQPAPQLFPENWDGASTVWMFARMVQARHVRVWPSDGHRQAAPRSDANPGSLLRVELLGCEPGVGHRCASGECTPRGSLCNGVEDCEDGSDEEGCVPPPAGAGRQGASESWVRTSPKSWGICADCDPQPHLPTGSTGPETRNGSCDDAAPAPHDDTRGPCCPGQVPCEVLGCVELEQLCDGREDCLDGSDERPCARASGTMPFTVPTTALPELPASRGLCSPSQLTCGSGECLPSERRCDLQLDCQDSSDENGCVDCGLSSWSGWSSCSRSCGLGLAFQRRELLRPPLPGGSCPSDRLRSQPCFVQACPEVPGWTLWAPWSACSRSCLIPGGGPALRSRSRLCPSPGDMSCPGEATQEEPCSPPVCLGPGGEWGPWSPCSVPCGGGYRNRTRGSGRPSPMDFSTCGLQPCAVTNCTAIEGAEYSACGPPCPRSCDDLVHCVWSCQPGCYCPPGQVLSADGTVCVQPGHCSCLDLLTGERHRPGAQLAKPDGCNYCTCSEGRLTCTDLPCPDCTGGQDLLPCGQPCPRSCEDLSPGVECQPDSTGCQQPSCGCPPGQLSQDGLCVPPTQCRCQYQPGAIGIPENQSRSVGSGLSSWESLEPGEVVTGPCDNCTCVAGILQCQEVPACSGPGLWGSWGPWEDCSVSCGGGEQLRSRRCPRPPCPGPARQSRTCRTQVCRELPLCLGPGCVAGNCSWTAWAPWEPCSRSCGVGQQRRLRAYRPPGPGGHWCPNMLTAYQERRFCNLRACPEEGCPAGMEVVSCANRCPRRCSDLQEGIVCQEDQACQQGCRCPEGLGAWTPWSPWADCPVSCGGGNQVRTRVCVALAPPRGGSPCLGPDAQSQRCGLWPCPALPDACSWGPWGPCSRSCGLGLASRNASCPCPLAEADPACNSTSLRLDTQACYTGPCLEECVWSSWSGWTRCSCEVLVQQRYRHQRPAPRGAGAGPPCTRLDGHFRPCLIGNCSEDSCAPPFEFQACGSPCTGLCATYLSPRLCQDLPPCQPGCYCPEGLLEQAGGCVPPEQCNCQHVSGEGAGVTLAPGDRLQLGCKEWTALEERWPQDTAGLSPTSAPMLASEQHRHRLCLDPETGRPWAGDPDLCTVPLSQQRLCPDPGACQDLCQWGPWRAWSPCQVPCSGGFRLRWREDRSPPGGGCWGPWAQTESCNMGPCPGESCEAQDTVPTPDCANQCPRSCIDLWDRVECLQGPCRPGCRCPPGQLVQDGRCVPVSSCRCGLPSPNASWALAPAEVVWLDCRNCTCVNGSLACSSHECPTLGPWSAWSNCSAPCGGGTTERHRSCKEGPGRALCQAQDTEQWQDCNLQPCPEEQPISCRHLTELRNLTKGACYLEQVEVNYCSGHCPSSTNVLPEEPYLQSQCDCCSYRLDPENPVRILNLRCPGGRTELVVLPVIHSCQCSACQGGDFSER
ncbi:hypothetical protein MJG53_006733 [Ovis ammon polii x Ovis aries]|uniref:Uncharacterized protein n=1 Tax=Ovis ammon polii x Ovis aries TaxID=2918886 RepID=A0ACB9V5I7_9CETA|nr:hypothetical protein MJG53_006733 [Ovis ammon polii x Ovis aries]